MDLQRSGRFIFLIACIIGVTFVDAGFRDATSVHDCLATLKKEAEHGGRPCDLMPDYMRCAIRTSGLLKTLTSSEAIQASQNALEDVFRSEGLYCSLDLVKIVNELRAEGYTGESTRDSDEPLTLENAKTVEECVEAEGKSKITCSDVPNLIKCSIRTEGGVEFLNTAEAIQKFDDMMTRYLGDLGIYCDVDYNKIFQELKQEGETKTEVHVASVDGAPQYGNTQNYGGPSYKVHNTYYQRNGGESTMMNALNLSIFALLVLLSILNTYIR